MMQKRIGASTCIFLVLMTILCPLSSSQNIMTIAGTTTEGKLATSVPVSGPNGVFVDGSGNIFIVDSGNHRIRKVHVNGTITTSAGNGEALYAGDGGPATSASLKNPSGIFVDFLGNIFIADYGNHRIRKVHVDGTITSVAGNGNPTYSGDGVVATNASLSCSGVFVDVSGDIFIADRLNHRIRKVNVNGIITTVAGNGTGVWGGDGGFATSASLKNPYGVFVDGSGNIFIADSSNHRIRKVNQSGIITTVCGNGTMSFGGDGGLATSASLTSPYGVFVDGSGNILIADYGNHRIRKVQPNGIVTTVAGNGNPTYSGDGGAAINASLKNPHGVVADSSGNIFIANFGNHRIRKVLVNGTISTLAGNGVTGDGGFHGDLFYAADALFNQPSAVFVTVPGNIYIADFGNNRIRKVNVNGIVTTVAGNGNGFFAGDGSLATSASLNTPSGIFVDGSGNIFVADFGNNRVRKVHVNGIITTVAGTGGVTHSGDGGAATSASLNPSSVFVDVSGNIFVADYANNRIRKVSLNGTITTVGGNGSATWGGDGGAATSASLKNPAGVFVDASGNIFIADYGNHRIRKVDLNGIITTVAGNGIPTYSGDGGAATNASLKNPSSVFVDVSGNIFIADYGNHRIRKVLVNGTITTVTGNGIPAYSGDGSLATNASLKNPYGIFVDVLGNIFIADRNNHRIRIVGISGIGLCGLVGCTCETLF